MKVALFSQHCVVHKTVIWCFLWSVFIGDHNQIISFDITKKKNKKWSRGWNILGGNIFWMNWHFNFKQCRLFNSRSISTIESPLRSWRSPFSQLFFSLFLGVQRALKSEKKCVFGKSQKKRLTNCEVKKKISKMWQPPRTYNFSLHYFSNFRALWRAENSVHVVFELWFCSTAQIQNYMKKQADIVEKNAKVDIISKLAIFVWKWVHIPYNIFSKNILSFLFFLEN